jgi:FeS assembly protein IscX
MDREVDRLSWEDSFAIARRLMAKFPDVELDSVSLNDIFDWTVNLPEFDDDVQLSNDAILLAIYREWLEEAHP